MVLEQVRFLLGALCNVGDTHIQYVPMEVHIMSNNTASHINATRLVISDTTITQMASAMLNGEKVRIHVDVEKVIKTLSFIPISLEVENGMRTGYNVKTQAGHTLYISVPDTIHLDSITLVK